jgi:hypothetical protein
MLLRHTRAIAHWSNAEGRRLQPAEGKFKEFDETAGFVVLASSEWFGILMCVCAFYIRGSPTNYKKRPVWQTSGKGAAGRAQREGRSGKGVTSALLQ